MPRGEQLLCVSALKKRGVVGYKLVFMLPLAFHYFLDVLEWEEVHGSREKFSVLLSVELLLEGVGKEGGEDVVGEGVLCLANEDVESELLCEGAVQGQVVAEGEPV